ncbi:hypothetical protein [Lacticaseibacillus sp. 866-1]|nr:hypothetical protein [Lacticaseibacillus sp. 866-1]
MILNILIVVYAALTIFAVIADWQPTVLVNWVSLAAAIFLLLGLRWHWAILVAIVLLLAAAIAQGYQRYGHIHWSHLVVRLLLSAAILVFGGLQHWH